MSEPIAEAYVRIRPDLTGFREELRAELEAATAADGKVRIDGDDAPLLDKIAAGVAAGDAARVTIPVDADVAPAMAAVAELKAATKMMGMPRSWLNAVAITRGGISNPQDYATKAALIEALAQSGSGGSGGGGVLAGLLAGEAGKGGGGGPGLMSLLGFGASGIPFLGGMAGMGTLAGLAGFGGEHVLSTLLGVGGSAAAGLGGAGLLGLGSLGVMGVGMGTDLAGIGQAAGDIRRAYTIMGNSALTAAQKQQQLNAALADLTAPARSAVMGAVGVANQFHSLFDQFTGTAEAIGAEIITQAMQVGEAFLPTIGHYAAQNMATIRADIQPFFSWLANPLPGGGLGIFTDLEREFSAHLPAAINAMTQGFELFAKIVDDASHYTGGLVDKLSELLTKWNSSAEQPKIERYIRDMIGDFRVWWAFLKQIADTIKDIFAPAVGAGSALIGILTGLLAQADAWLTSAKGKHDLTALFTAHLGELQQMGKTLGSLVGPLMNFVGAFVQIETSGVGAFTIMLKVLNPVLKLLTGNKVTSTLLGWALAFELVGTRLTPLIGAVKLLGKTWATTGTEAATAGGEEDLAAGGGKFSASGVMSGLAGVAGLGFAGVIGGSLLAGATEPKHDHLARDLTTAGVGVMGAGLGLMQLNPLAGGAVMGVGGLVAAAGEIIAHWKGVKQIFKDVADFLSGDLGTAISGAVAFFVPVIGLPMLIIGHWRGLVGFFTRDLPGAFGAFERFFERLPGEILHGLQRLPGLLLDAAKEAGRMLLQGFEWGVALVVFAAIETPKLIATGLEKLGQLLYGAAVDAWDLFSSATTTVVGTIVGFVEALPGRIVAFFTDLPGMLSRAAKTAWDGFVNAMTTAAEAIWTFAKDLPGKILGFLTGLPTLLTKSGKGLITGLFSGMYSIALDVFKWFGDLPSAIEGYFAGAGQWLYNVGRDIISGLAKGIESMFGSIKSDLGKLTSWIPSWKGPASVDAALLYGSGVLIMQGLQDGIRSQVDDLHSLLGQVSAEIAPAFNPALSLANPAFYSDTASIAAAASAAVKAAAPAALSYQAPNVNITIKGDATEQTANLIAAHVRNALDADHRQLLAEIGQQIGVSR